SGADAVHPGYGLLSESPSFARAVAEAGKVFIGPPVEALEQLGDKLRAREIARAAGVEPPPGTTDPIDPADRAQLEAAAASVGYPILVKAAAGGGGIGMSKAQSAEELVRAATAAADRAGQAFGDPR